MTIDRLVPSNRIGRALSASAVLVLALSIGATPAAAERFTERVEESYPLAAGGEVSLENTNGSVTVEAWSGSSVEMVAEKVVDSRDRESAEEAFDKIEIVVTEDATGVHIETEHPRASASGLFDWLLGRARNASVRYTLRVPLEAEIRIRTVNGGMKTFGVAGPQRLSSTNGHIEVREALDRVEASTTNGGIKAELAGSAGRIDVRLSSTNGGLSLHLPADARGHLDARTVNGSVKSEIPILTTGGTSRRRMEGQLNGGGRGDGSVELRTVNGGIRISETDA